LATKKNADTYTENGQESIELLLDTHFPKNIPQNVKVIFIPNAGKPSDVTPKELPHDKSFFLLVEDPGKAN